MSKRKPPALLDWESAGGQRSNDQLGVITADEQHTPWPDPIEVGILAHRLHLYARESEAIVVSAADAVGIADMLLALVADRGVLLERAAVMRGREEVALEIRQELAREEASSAAGDESGVPASGELTAAAVAARLDGEGH